MCVLFYAGRDWSYVTEERVTETDKEKNRETRNVGKGRD